MTKLIRVEDYECAFKNLSPNKHSDGSSLHLHLYSISSAPLAAMATTFFPTAASAALLPSASLSSHSSKSLHATPSKLLAFRALAHGEILTGDGRAVATPFHLAIPVHDIRAAREFFGGVGGAMGLENKAINTDDAVEVSWACSLWGPFHSYHGQRRVLGCPEGRSAKTWVDFNLFGHQVVCHEVFNYKASSTANAVDGDPVPVPHFGLAMSVPDFHALADRVRAAGIQFIIEPHIRFSGQPGEQWTMFFKDRSGNALEFKAMTTPSNLFAKYVVE